jgi:hypothetical protein
MELESIESSFGLIGLNEHPKDRGLAAVELLNFLLAH